MISVDCEIRYVNNIDILGVEKPFAGSYIRLKAQNRFIPK
jgi:hypothetical protein